MGRDQSNRGLQNLFTVLCAKKGMLLISDVCHALVCVCGGGMCQTAANYPLEDLFPTHTNIPRPARLRMV